MIARGRTMRLDMPVSTLMGCSGVGISAIRAIAYEAPDQIEACLTFFDELQLIARELLVIAFSVLVKECRTWINKALCYAPSILVMGQP